MSDCFRVGRAAGWSMILAAMVTVASCTGAGEGAELAEARMASAAIEVAEEVQEELDNDPDLAAAVEQYQRFIVERDAALMGDGDAFDRLVGMSSSFVIDDLRAEVERYRTMRESADLSVAISTASSVAQTIVLDNGNIRIRDCLEVQQSEDSGVVDPVQLVWQESRMAAVEGVWTVDRFITRHDGQSSAAERFGCVPESHRARLTETAAGFFSALVEVERNAALAWPDELDDLTDQGFAAELKDGLGGAVREREVTSPLAVRLVGAASDAHSNGYAWEVPVCLRYPEGKQWTWLDDGEVVVEEPFLPLSEVVVNVQLASEFDGTDYTDAVVGLSEPVAGRCWESGDDPMELTWS